MAIERTSAAQPGPTIEQQPLTRIDAITPGETFTRYAIPAALDTESIKYLPDYLAEDAYMRFHEIVNHQRSLLEEHHPNAVVIITELRENTNRPYPKGIPISELMTSDIK